MPIAKVASRLNGPHSKAMDREEYRRWNLAFDLGRSDYFEQSVDRLYETYRFIDQCCGALWEAAVVDVGGCDGIFIPSLWLTGAFSTFYVIDNVSTDSPSIALKSTDVRLTADLLVANIERDRFPMDDGVADVAVFLETIEHLLFDPMHALLEINRLLGMGGSLFLSTPNLNSSESIVRILRGNNPNVFTAYREKDKEYTRHNREFTIRELELLLNSAGFAIDLISTLPTPRLKAHLGVAALRLLVGGGWQLGRLGATVMLAARKIRHVDSASMPFSQRYPRPVYQYLQDPRTRDSSQ